MSGGKRKKIGPSTAELRLRGDLDQMRRQLNRIKKEGLADGAGPAETTKLQEQLDQLEKTRAHLSKLYFSQIDENRRQTSRTSIFESA